MSRHEGVSCDSCLKSNFRGRRYKCLICYDYDLCANCYEEGVTSTRHSTDHPMQCILTRTDFELYYGGEVLTPDQPQSFTCPYCKRMGLSDSALLEHVSSEHTDTGLEVVCPVCAALPGGDPNLVTDDFAGHLSLEHRNGSRDLISFLDEPSAIRHGGVRRMPHSGRALGGPRSRRSNMHFSSSGGGLSTLSPSGRESVDPIAELLQQLSSVRRGGAPQPSQLQQLQMQIQLERQQVTAARQQLERLPRRQQQSSVSSSTNASGSGITTGNVITSQPATSIVSLNAASSREAPIASPSSLQMVTSSGTIGPSNHSAPNILTGGSGGLSSTTSHQEQSTFLMARFLMPRSEDSDLAQQEQHNVDRSQFVQSLLLSTIADFHCLSKLRYEDEGDERSSLNIYAESSGVRATNEKDTKRVSHGGTEIDENQEMNNNNNNDSFCDRQKHSSLAATMDSSNDGLEDLLNLPPNTAQVFSRGNSQHHSAIKGGVITSKIQSVGGGGGCVGARSRQQQQQQAVKAREHKQVNSVPASAAAPSKHVADTR